MNRPNVTALARQLARQQAVIAERDAEIAELKQMVDALGETIDLLLDDSEERIAEIERLQTRVAELEDIANALDKPITCEPIALKKVWLFFGSEGSHATE